MLEPLEPRIAPATLLVTSTADSGAGSFRQAVLDSNANKSVTDTIVFSLPAGSTIALASGINISDDVNIAGPGAASLTISGNTTFQLLLVDDGQSAAIAVTLSGLTFINGKASGDGGAILSREFLTLKSCAFFNNLALSNGGAISAGDGGTGAHLVIDGCQLVNNQANSSGGALYAASNANVAILNSVLANNSGVVGGAAFLTELAGGTGDLYLVHSTVIGNFSPNAHGAIVMENTRPGPDGQNHTADDGTALIYQSLIAGNVTNGDGGGVAFFNGRASVIGSMLKDNISYKGGGGIAALAGTDSLTITGSSFQGNQSRGNNPGHGGGALYLASTNGNATFVASISTSEFVGNYSDATGGAIQQDGAALALLQTSFRANIADNGSTSHGGGAIDAVDNNAPSPLTVTLSEFISNSSLADGGAIYHSGTGPVKMSMVAFTQNHAEFSGGAAKLETSPTVNLQYIAATGNSARAHGGAFDIFSTGQSVLDYLLLTGNAASGTAGNARGGALALDGASVKTLAHAIIQGNISRANGGGISIAGGTLNISQTQITGNFALTYGGLSATGSGTYSLGANVSISGNLSTDGLQKPF